MQTEYETKAKELVEKFRKEYSWVEKDYNVDLWRDAKQCALICCQLLIDENDDIENMVGQGFNKEYWQQVRTALNQL